MFEAEDNLRKAGLTGNEAKIYFELLKQSSVSANHLAKKLGMDRTLVYQVLNNLCEKGLANHVKKENKKYFQAASPDNLMNPLKEKQAFIIDLIPQLKAIEKVKEISQEINVYEGKEGIRALMNLALKEKELLVFGSTGRAFYALYEMPRIAKQAMESNIKTRIIGSRKYKGTEAFAFKKFEFRFLGVESNATTCIFGDRISIHLLTQKPLVIIIKNKEIAESYKNYFEVLWKIAKK